ncbi:MAG TPA: glycosyltransferase [Acidobacteriota bacterium]|nr:glycosyltransferase [Acidobacteriota bacterium]
MLSFLFVDTERVWRGGQDQLLSLLGGLHQRGHEVHLICHPKTLLENRAHDIGVHVHPVLIRSEFGLIAFFKVLAVLRRTHPEVLAFNTPRPILLGVLASRFTSVRVRLIFRRVNFPLRRSPLTKLKYRWGIDCIVAISESIRYQLQAGGVPAARIRTIYEGMDLSVHPTRERTVSNGPQGLVTIGTVAHLSPEKGLTYLVKAAAGIPDVRSRMRFVIVGDGQCRQELEAEVRDHNLQSSFSFLGFQSRIAEHLESFDIFVLPSLSEGLSSAILTAMASCVPVIATDVGGIPELIRDGENGLLVSPMDSAGLARAIERLARDPAERCGMGLAGRRLVEDRFTLQRKIVETEQLCMSLLQSKGSPPRPANDEPTGKSAALLEAGPDRAAFLILAGSISLSLVSIAASQILLAAAITAAVWLWKRRGKDFVFWPRCSLPLCAFAFWTLLTVLVSYDTHTSILELKKFFIYLIVFLVPLLIRGKGAAIWVYRAIFAAAALSGLKGISQFASNPHRGLSDRISGFMSQWMTYSGLLMLVLVALASFICVFGFRRHKWILPIGFLLAVPLYLSETRSAQWGAVAGMLVVMLLLRKMRAVAALLVIILAIYIVSPSSVRQRLRSAFDLADPNTRNRIELFGTAVRLIQDNPWFGVGPKNVGHEALRYRGTHEWPDWMYQHMHNNVLQIAAERGIPGLLIWLWFMVALAWDALRSFRLSRKQSDQTEANREALLTSAAALGAWTALMIAGAFEYNFGDSEVLTLFLFMMSVAFTLRPRDTAHTEDNPACCMPVG